MKSAKGEIMSITEKLKETAQDVVYLVLGIDTYKDPTEPVENYSDKETSDPIEDYRQELREAKLKHYGLDDDFNIVGMAVGDDIEPPLMITPSTHKKNIIEDIYRDKIENKLEMKLSENEQDIKSQYQKTPHGVFHRHNLSTRKLNSYELLELAKEITDNNRPEAAADTIMAITDGLLDNPDRVREHEPGEIKL